MLENVLDFIGTFSNNTHMDLKALAKAKGFETSAALGKAVADKIGCDPTTVSKIADGKSRDPRMSTLKGLSKVLRRSISRVIQAIENTEAA